MLSVLLFVIIVVDGVLPLRVVLLVVDCRLCCVVRCCLSVGGGCRGCDDCCVDLLRCVAVVVIVMVAVVVIVVVVLVVVLAVVVVCVNVLVLPSLVVAGGRC